MRVGLQIWNAADPDDRKAWIEWWEQWPDREIFGHPNYVRLYAGSGSPAFCAAGSVDGSCVLYPFLLRSLGAEPYCDPSLRNSRDIATAYGYGGPFRWGTEWGPEAADLFWREFDAWASKSRVVSEVVRLALFPETLLAYPGARRVLFENVVRSIRSEDELWRDFEHKVRKNVNRARASRVTVQIDEAGDRLEEFLAIYSRTMNRRNAKESYYFPRQYFEQIHTELKGQFAYFHARVGGAVVSTELVLISAHRVYSFLGGTDAEWFQVRPNDLLKIEIMNWARSAGKKEFVLGGGYSCGDGIYRYKLSFAPGGNVPFAIGSRILDINAYEELIRARTAFGATEGQPWAPNPDYFPAYRG